MKSIISMAIESKISEAVSGWWKTSNHDNEHTADILTLVVILFSILWYIWIGNILAKYKFRLPPGPKAFPLLGSLPFVDPDLHIYFSKLTEKYGPIFKVNFASRHIVVVGSPETAREVLKDNDSIFANRDPSLASLIISYGGSDILTAQLGPELRMLRTVLAQEIMGKIKVESIRELRRQEVRQTIQDVYSKTGSPINISEQMFLTMLNVLTSMLWGGTLKGEERRSIGKKFRQVIEEMNELLGKSNISDLLPVLAKFDLQGIELKIRKVHSWLDRTFESAINQRIQLNQASGAGNDSVYKGNKDFLDVLLQLLDRKDPKTPFTITHLKALFTDIMLAGTDTTATTFEWAMTELMLHPEIMKKVQEELEEVVGRNEMVDETHIPNLHYLNAVIKETLRLHPSVPLLVSRRSSESCLVAGYTVPKRCRVLVNVWAIQRNPEVWKNPLEFDPERFLKSTSKWDFTGSDFRYIPFGSGRRICAGIPMVERLLPYVLASLVHLFDWKLPKGVDLEVTEKFGIVMKKKTALIAIPNARFVIPKLYC